MNKLFLSFLILFLFILSIVFIGLTILRERQNPSTDTITTKFTIPSRNQYAVGEVFPISLDLSGIITPINIVQADLEFDPKAIEIVDISLTDSLATFFVQVESNNDQGYIRVTGGIPNPGYSDSSGHLATIYFRGILPGPVELKYLDSSLVLANDGHGTSILSSFPSIPILITASDSPATSPSPIYDIIEEDDSPSATTPLTFTQYAHDLPRPSLGR